MILMTKPISPISKTPSKHILIESQSSLLPGFFESLSILAHDWKKDKSPRFIPLQRPSQTMDEEPVYKIIFEIEDCRAR